MVLAAIIRAENKKSARAGFPPRVPCAEGREDML